MKRHELKTDPDAFNAVLLGTKTHEIRKNDRGFAVGDELLLHETELAEADRPTDHAHTYTGRELLRRVTHIQEGYGLAPGWAILSIERVPQEGDWIVRERRDPDGALMSCFVQAPREGDMAYGLEVLGDDYEGYGDVERKLEHCKMIVALVNAARGQVSPADYEEVLADHRRLARELDVLLNGEEGAAKQASLADIVAQVRRERQQPRDETYLFEHWAKDPIRAAKIPLAKHPNGAYTDTRSYLINYGWKSRAKQFDGLFAKPENIDPFTDTGEGHKDASYERLRLACAIQQPAPIPDQMALVWRADIMRMRHDLTHKQAFFDYYRPLSQAMRDVIAERKDQVTREGYTTEDDDAHVQGELGAYAAYYAMPPGAREWPATETGYGATWGEAIIPADWTPPKPGDRRRELVKAGALILADIERIDRADAPATTGEQV
jgi:hypothetical protein